MTDSYRLLQLFCLLCICKVLAAQDNIDHADSIAIKNSLRFYHQSSGDQSGIYNGSLYIRPTFTINQGHIFFRTDSLTTGKVLYDGFLYDSVRLLYDEVKDELVTTDYQGLHLVRLVKDKVDRFSIAHNSFIHVRQVNGSMVDAGFYQLLHHGKWQVLLREKKFLREKIIHEKEITRFIEVQQEFWIQTEKGMQRINNLRGLLFLFGEARKEVQQHLRARHLRYKQDKAKAIVEAVRHFESLPPS